MWFKGLSLFKSQVFGHMFTINYINNPDKAKSTVQNGPTRLADGKASLDPLRSVQFSSLSSVRPQIGGLECKFYGSGVLSVYCITSETGTPKPLANGCCCCKGTDLTLPPWTPTAVGCCVV